MNIEDDCCCGEADYGVFGDADLCPRCRAAAISAYDPKRAAEADRLRKRQEARERVSRDFNLQMINLYNEARRRT